MIASILLSAAPLVLAALGGLLSVVSGPPAVFLEGFMILGAFLSWAFHLFGLPIWLSALAAAFLAAGLAWASARFVHASGANPFMVGLAINLAAAGVVDALSVAWFGTKGVLLEAAPSAAESASPYGINGFTIAAAVLVLAAGPLLRRTRWGLRIRACGASEQVPAERGVDPVRYRSQAWAAAAVLAALAGAALSYRIGAYAPGGVAGRGWVALVLVYLGFKRPLGIGAAALAFAAAESIAGAAQGLGTIPATVLLGLPSALALAAFAVSSYLRTRYGRSLPNLFRMASPKRTR